MHEALDILRWFWIARRRDRETDRARLEARQQRLIAKLQRDVFPRSRFYAGFAHAPFEALPIIDKAQWMGAFDEINTVDVKLNDALRVAEEAERSRDFTPTLHGVTIGLSTGTSGKRGVFLVSPAERRRWAGVMLAKLLPERPFAKRRVAFLLRADSRLYQSASAFGPIDFRYFDMMQPWPALLGALNTFAPHILIAPASALRILADGGVSFNPERIISIAETLHEDDRTAIAAAFDAPLAEVYQATEGALAMTCARGVLHLNEEWVRVEEDWIDRASGRFAPIVTDLTRTAQPVVRYRLDDVLTLGPPCACGRASRPLLAIEGRCDDICTLRRADGALVRLFPDLLVRAILGASADIGDFTLTQTAPGAFDAALRGGEGAQSAVIAALAALARRFGAEAPRITFTPYRPPAAKRRRVTVLKPFS